PAMKNILISSRDNVDVLPADIHFLAKPFSFDSLGILVTLFIPPVNQVMIPDANRLDRNARLNLA
ncbi:MAG TPA: hypothetical protein DIW28_08065, partial [Zetaproteobacteria bacterium]|nr:hypothetical protein [Zetaproteobacteria bacterium]